MQNNFMQLLFFVLALVIIGLVISGITYIVLSLLLSVYRWLFRQPWFSTRIKQIRTNIKNYWDKNTKTLVILWEFISEIIIDPLFYGYALVVVVDRLQALNEFSVKNPQWGFSRILDADMNTSPSIYIAFFIIFTLWMLSKSWKHRQEIIEKKATRESLVNIAKELKKVNKHLKNLSKRGD